MKSDRTPCAAGNFVICGESREQVQAKRNEGQVSAWQEENILINGTENRKNGADVSPFSWGGSQGHS